MSFRPFRFPLAVLFCLLSLAPRPTDSARGQSAGQSVDSCRRPAVAAMLRALAATDSGQMLTITDGNPRDHELAVIMSGMAASRDVRVFPLVFLGACSPIDPLYARIADASGGQMFALTRPEVEQISRIADFVVRSDVDDLAFVSDTLSGTARTYKVPIDSTVNAVTFSLSGVVTTAALKRPDGSEVEPNDVGVSSLKLSNALIYSASNPARGEWSVTVNGSGPFSLRVLARSEMGFSSFEAVELKGRPLHEGFFPVGGFPLAGQTSKVSARSRVAEARTARFEFRSTAGALLQAFDLEEVPWPGGGRSGEYYGEATFPNAPFVVYVTGLDAKGRAYQRALPSVITPQTVQITPAPTRELRQGQTTRHVFRVKNLGPPDSFRFTGFDAENFFRSASPSTFTLNTNQTQEVSVELLPAPATEPGELSDLVVGVESTRGTGAQNYAVVKLMVKL